MTSIILRLRRTVVRLPVIAALGMLPLACGRAEDSAAQKPAGPPTAGASAAAPARAPIDACTLVTGQEAEAALGKPVTEPTRENVPPIFSCKYATEGGLENISVTVTAHNDARQATDAYALAVKINDYTEITGIGDRAYRSVVYDIHVLKGRYELSVDVTQPVDKETQFQKAKDLASRALTRLP